MSVSRSVTVPVGSADSIASLTPELAMTNVDPAMPGSWTDPARRTSPRWHIRRPRLAVFSAKQFGRLCRSAQAVLVEQGGEPLGRAVACGRDVALGERAVDHIEDVD